MRRPFHDKLMIEFGCSKTYNFLTRFSLLLLALVLILVFNPSCAIAQENDNTAGATSIGNSPCVVQAHNQHSFKPEIGKLKDANKNFHTDYDRLVVEESTKFGHPEGSTVLIVSASEITFCHDGKKRNYKLADDPDIYHILKAIGHHPLGIYLTLSSLASKNVYEITAPLPFSQSEPGQTIEEYLRDRERTLKEALTELRNGQIYQVLDSQDLSQLKESQENLLQESIDYITQVLRVKEIDSKQLNKYVEQIYPYIVQGANQAAKAELEALNNLIKTLKPKTWKSPYVVVQTAHQARYRDTATQYFEQMFNEPQGNAAERENRIVVIENNFDDNDALRLLASHIIDQKIGLAFFHDPKRMQRDLLGDAATFWLWEHELEIPELGLGRISNKH
ncbi:MAG: hypothetical protein F6K41_12670 [Symploca sp. SIO3E6]|nr:hypothetical protein [Caldora sp. SIO3E6]